MVKKKTTKEIRAIDRIIKFQIDDGIESITIGGKEALADLEIDNKNNVTLYLNADKDKINELHSLVPFINLAVNEYWADPDKQKSVTLSQDLTQFALEIAGNSKELASIIKTESSIVLDLDGLVQQLLEIAGKIAKLEAKDLEQDNRLTEIEEKDQEQDNRLTVIEEKDQEQDDRLTTLESNVQQEQLYNVSTNTVVHTFSDGTLSFDIIVTDKNEDSNVFGHITILYNNPYILDNNPYTLDTIQLSQIDSNSALKVYGNMHNYIITYVGGCYVVSVVHKEPSLVFSSSDFVTVNSVLYRETPDKENKHNMEIIEFIETEST